MNLVTKMAALVGNRGGTDDALRVLLDDGVRTAAGRVVTVETAQQCVAVLACVRVIAETVASLPLFVYRRGVDDARERDPKHPLYPILHDQANPEQTALEFRELMMANALLWGNAYAEVERAGGAVRALWPLVPGRMQETRDPQDRPVFVYTLPDGSQVSFRSNQLHIWRGPWGGQSPIALARQAVGLALATEEYGARFFGNDSRPGGVLTHPGRLSDEAAARLKADWEAAHGGLKNRHRVAILEEGLAWQAVGIPPQDAQFLETRKYQTQEIARLYRVPLHLLQDLDRATWGNIEHQAIDYVVHTIRPWLVRIEQATARDLLADTPSRRTHFAEFLVDGLLRGDAMTRAQALAIQRQNGVLTANEWRAIENRNPIAGGDALLINGNMVPIDQAGAQPAPAPPAGGTNAA